MTSPTLFQLTFGRWDDALWKAIQRPVRWSVGWLGWAGTLYAIVAVQVAALGAAAVLDVAGFGRVLDLLLVIAIPTLEIRRVRQLASLRPETPDTLTATWFRFAKHTSWHRAWLVPALTVWSAFPVGVGSVCWVVVFACMGVSGYVKTTFGDVPRKRLRDRLPRLHLRRALAPVGAPA